MAIRTCWIRYFSAIRFKSSPRPEHRCTERRHACLRGIVVNKSAHLVADRRIQSSLAKQHHASGPGSVNKRPALLRLAERAGSLRHHSHQHSNSAGEQQAKREIDQIDRSRKSARRDRANSECAEHRRSNVGCQQRARIWQRNIAPSHPIDAEKLKHRRLDQNPDQQSVNEMFELPRRNIEFKAQ